DKEQWLAGEAASSWSCWVSIVTTKAGGPKPTRHGPLLALRFGNLLFCCGDDRLDAEPEFLLQVLKTGRRAERPHADAVPVDTDVASPPESGRHLDRHAGADRRGEHLLAVFGVLLAVVLEDFPRRQADDSGRDPRRLQLLPGPHSQRDFAARGQ